MPGFVLPETCAPPNLLWVWPGSAAYLGTSLNLAPHSTSVYCLVVGVDEAVTITVAGQRPVVGHSVLIPPRTVHHVTTAPNTRTLFCYADIHRSGAVELRGRMRRDCGVLAADHDGEDRLLALCNTAPTVGEACTVGEALMATALTPRSVPMDSRIVRTVQQMRVEPGVTVGAGELAAAEGLSRSHFLRLFGRETGTTFRRYRLWLRMLWAAQALAAGADLTQAAADAGFASPSHFSDTFLQMFGLTATSLMASGVQLIVPDPVTRDEKIPG